MKFVFREIVGIIKFQSIFFCSFCFSRRQKHQLPSCNFSFLFHPKFKNWMIASRIIFSPRIFFSPFSRVLSLSFSISRLSTLIHTRVSQNLCLWHSRLVFAQHDVNSNSNGCAVCWWHGKDIVQQAIGTNRLWLKEMHDRDRSIDIRETLLNYSSSVLIRDDV